MDKTDRLRDYGLAFLLYEQGLGICGYELIRELFIFIKLILNSYLFNEFNKITECMFKDEYQSESKIILKTILIQFYSLYASLRVTLLKAYKVKELEGTLNKIKQAIKTVTEDKCSKDEIEKVVKEVKNEIEKSNSLFYNNK